MQIILHCSLSERFFVFFWLIGVGTQLMMFFELWYLSIGYWLLCDAREAERPVAESRHRHSPSPSHNAQTTQSIM